MKKIYVVSHCVLNTFSKVKHIVNKDYIDEETSRKRFLNKIINEDNMIIQLPCPEFLMYGINRNGFARSQFDNVFFKEKCREILKPIILQIEEYLSSEKDDFTIEIIGINGSPSCGVDFSYDAKNAEGEAELSKNKVSFMNNNKGIFMEILENMLKEKDINLKFIPINKF